MKGQLEEAVSLYKLSLRHIQTAEAHTFLGWTYSFMGKLDEAIEGMSQSHCLRSPFRQPVQRYRGLPH